MDVSAKAFGVSSVQEATIVNRRCCSPVCGQAQAVDGAEFLILRKGQYSSHDLGPFELCFT
jgi:hypothetical protein